MMSVYTTTISDLPDVILSNIISTISDTRTRNSASLVSHKWYLLDRNTRSSLTLRANIRDLFMLPNCFTSITNLDISLLSPWGHSLTSSINSDPDLTVHLLTQTFPNLTSLTLYARDPSTIQLLVSHWHFIKHLKLVRWHQRPVVSNPGDELRIVFSGCGVLSSLDLSSFYCWAEDVAIGIQGFPNVGFSLSCLNLMNPAFHEGFKSDQIKVITKVCPNLVEFRAACMFDVRYIGFVGDEALVAVSVNCPKLVVLHLADRSGLSGARGDPEHDGFTQEDAGINVATLIEVFSGLPMLEDLVLDVCDNVRDSGPALEVLNSKCPRLKRLKLGQFHGISMPVESKLDGVAICQGLESLSIKNVGDLTDMGLIAIGRGCCRLAKFEVVGCKKITMRGMRTLASLLRRTLIDVRISCCKNLGAASSLKALEPVQDRIERLHIDCVWDSSAEELEDFDGVVGNGFDLNHMDQGEVLNQSIGGHTSDYFQSNQWEDYEGTSNPSKKCKYSYDLNSSSVGFDVNDNGYENENGFGERTWDRLQHLSLWIGVGQLLTPLPNAGLHNCPNLEEIRIKIEGDSREMSRPSEREFGLRVLFNYPQLSKMHLDCGEIIGYAHTAPSGQTDLSVWERFHLYGIGHLRLRELDYWPPQDRDVNQRSLSLPAIGLLQGCTALRKLFIHGTTHEHFMRFFLEIPGLRDVQLREDYYPAPENDMSTEMRADSCSRFETALNRRQIPD